MSKEAMNLALEVLERHVQYFDHEQFTSVCELDPAKDAITALQEALAEQPAQQEPTVSKAAYNRLRDDYNDLVKKSEQDAKYAKEWRAHVNRCQLLGVDLDYQTTTPQPAPVQQDPVAFDVTLEGQEAQALHDLLGDDRDNLSPLRLVVGDGHSGYGLYIALAEYQDEGAELFASITPPAQRKPLTDDPLQGAVDWLLEADGEYFCTATVQRTLRIGYNRAKRLCDTAKERAAHGIKENT